MFLHEIKNIRILIIIGLFCDVVPNAVTIDAVTKPIEVGDIVTVIPLAFTNPFEVVTKPMVYFRINKIFKLTILNFNTTKTLPK